LNHGFFAFRCGHNTKLTARTAVTNDQTKDNMNSILAPIRAAAILLCVVFTSCAQKTVPGPTNEHVPANAPSGVKPSASSNPNLKRQPDALAVRAPTLRSNAPVVVRPPTRRLPDRSFTNYWSGSSFPPDSLMNACWTNYLAKTNGAQFELWSKYILPAGWPTHYAGMPDLQRADDCLVHGAVGLTALCQCHTGQGYRGQVPMIAITRRHLYSRGHGMGVEFSTNVPVLFNYRTKLYFCTADNKVIEAVSTNKLVYYGGGYDFSIIALTADLPPDIVPVRCINPAVFGPSPCAFPDKMFSPEPMISTRQNGRLDCGWRSGHNEPIRGGDSGSPGFLWIGNELFFSFAISGSGPVVPKVQEGVDKLTRLLGLPTSKYQIQYLDVSRYPTYH
jgi:hypothetical protein